MIFIYVFRRSAHSAVRRLHTAFFALWAKLIVLRSAGADGIDFEKLAEKSDNLPNEAEEAALVTKV